MNEIYETSSGAGEVSERALKIFRKNKKPGDSLFSSISKALGLFALSQLFSMIVVALYFMPKVVNLNDNGFKFDISLESGFFTETFLLIYLISELFMIAIFIMYAGFKEKLSPQSLGFVLKKLPVSYLAGGAGAALSMFLLALICKFTGAMAFSHAHTNISLMILFAIGFVIQGLAEEVMCRGFLIAHITRRYSVKTAVIASSILFALLHAFNPSGLSVIAVINLFLYGVFASLMFLYSENIWLCAGFHTVWNFTQGNVIGVPVSGIAMPSFFKMTANEDLTLIHGGSFGLEGSIPATVILAVGCLFLYFLIKRRTNNKAVQ